MSCCRVLFLCAMIPAGLAAGRASGVTGCVLGAGLAGRPVSCAPGAGAWAAPGPDATRSRKIFSIRPHIAGTRPERKGEYNNRYPPGT